MNLKSYYIPELFRRYFDFYTEETYPGFNVEYARFKPEFFSEGARIFEEYAAKILRKLTCDEIMTHLDAVSAKFCDPGYIKRIVAVDTVSKATSFSPEACSLSIDLEFSSSRLPEMTAAMKNEFGDYAVLDGFVENPNLKGYTKAVPNLPVFAVCSSNIPALPHLSIMRSFMTKNPVVLKTSRGEPFFTPLYMEALAEAGSALSECAVVVCYKSSDTETTDRLIEMAKTVIVYGGPGTSSYFAKKALHPKKLIMHDHKLGFGVIGNGFIGCMNSGQLADLAAKIAFDVSTFEQRACLAPHVYFYGAAMNPDVDEFARYLVAEFEKEEAKNPPAALAPAAAYQRRAFIDSQIFSGDVQAVLETKSKKSAVIVSGRKEFPVSPLDRTLFLTPFSKNEEAFARLAPLRGFFQNVSLNAAPDDLPLWLEELSKLGVSRICPAGRMPTPTMMWHHDGIPALSEMVRFIDIEVFDSDAFKL